MTHPAPDRSWTLPKPGDTLAGKYVLEAECGRGGLAVVFSAVQGELDRRVAIKMLLPEWANDPEVVERFVREGRAATCIKSEHVARVFDVGTQPNGAPYLVLEYLEGHNLDEIVRTWGPLPVPTAIDWLLQAAEAIAEAHAHGIVHRDLKPANLFLTQHADGTPCIKVIDFGLSKITSPRLSGPVDPLTQTTDIIGSPHYMAPEQLRSSQHADARTDLWALGVVLYEFLAGKPPFIGATLPELYATVLTQPVVALSTVRPHVPPAVEQAIMRCLQKEPEARFASIGDLARALAPYGSRRARASFDRIDRTSREPGRLSDWPLLPTLPDPPEDDPWRAADDGRPFRTPTSARVVVGSFVMLSGLFIGAFMWIYADVHAGEKKGGGVTSMQPSLQAPAEYEGPPALQAPAGATPTDAVTLPPPATFGSAPPADAPVSPASPAASAIDTASGPAQAVDRPKGPSQPGLARPDHSRRGRPRSGIATLPPAPQHTWASDTPAGVSSAGGDLPDRRLPDPPLDPDPYWVPATAPSASAPAPKVPTGGPRGLDSVFDSRK
ncbi:MAG TPA: protein kinase [Polyangiaceae bacterium]|nr:protein kinase [Polyangiaceae bacterium]